MAVHAHPVLRRQAGAAIINVASVTGPRPRPGKAAVISVTQSLAAELAPDRIRVNAIAPAIGRTPMAEGMFDGDQDALDGMVQTIPLGRLCLAEDIAAAATYLASDEAAVVFGVVLPVDGGRMVG